MPNLPAPPGHDLLQVLWCPFETHGFPHAPAIHLRRRDSMAALDAVLTNPPLPAVVGYEGLVPEPCVLHPEPGVVEYEWPELLSGGRGPHSHAHQGGSEDGTFNVFVCPADPAHDHRTSLQG
ncbi:MAG: hypothetical protein HOV73_09025 [Streptomyces sp.]|nr:hypothetical protein [Streptomyces sp.]